MISIHVSISADLKTFSERILNQRGPEQKNYAMFGNRYCLRVQEKPSTFFIQLYQLVRGTLQMIYLLNLCEESLRTYKIDPYNCGFFPLFKGDTNELFFVFKKADEKKDKYFVWRCKLDLLGIRSQLLPTKSILDKKNNIDEENTSDWSKDGSVMRVGDKTVIRANKHLYVSQPDGLNKNSLFT